MGTITRPCCPRGLSVTQRRACLALFAMVLALWGIYAAQRSTLPKASSPAPITDVSELTARATTSPIPPAATLPIPPVLQTETVARSDGPALSIDELAPSDFPSAFDALLRCPSPENTADPLLIALLTRWAASDLDAARQAWSQLPDDSTRRALLPLLARRLPAEQTLAWIRTLPDACEQRRASGHLAVALAPSDAPRAFALANEATPDAPGDEFMIEVAGIVARRSPLEAAQLLTTQPRTSPREILLANFTRDWSRTDPAAATEFACRHLESADTRESVIQELLVLWEKRDPAALKRWLDATRNDRSGREIATLLPSSLTR